MTCVARPGRSGGSRCGTRPAWPPGKRPCPVRHPFPARLQCRGRQTTPGRHPFPAKLQFRGWHPFRGRLTILVAHRYRGRHRLREPYPFRVRHPLRSPGRGGSRPSCRSAPHLSPGSGNRTLPGRAARAPRRAGYLRCWRGGPCFGAPGPPGTGPAWVTTAGPARSSAASAPAAGSARTATISAAAGATLAPRCSRGPVLAAPRAAGLAAALALLACHALFSALPDGHHGSTPCRGLHAPPGNSAGNPAPGQSRSRNPGARTTQLRPLPTGSGLN